jgi:hypothetical protein
VSLGSTLPVSVTASDDQGLSRVVIEFDANGNGIIDEPTESITATNTGGNNFTATVPVISGTPGSRTLRAIALDTSENLAVSEISLNVTGGGPVLASVSPNGGQQGQTLAAVTIVGQNTSFLQGTTTADFGVGLSVLSLTVSSPTMAVARVSIATGASLGSRTVILRTGTETASLVNGFNIFAVGDVNGDGVVNCADVSAVRAAFGTRSGQPGFDQRLDFNGDGVIDIRDLAVVAQHLPAGTTCQ